MITLRDIRLSYGQRTLYGGLNVAIAARDRIGLAGSNGAGKSTLLKVLCGLTELDGGEVEKASWVSVGYLPQEGIRAQGQTLYEEASSAFKDIREAEQKLEAASARLQTLAPADPEYTELLEQIGAFEHYLDAADAHTLRPRVERVLSGLGFSAQDSDRDCGEFSGGWQMRIALAKLLLREPSLLLLDEPTNHLDIESLRWLEQYLCSYSGAMIIVSHDRAFLDALCTRTWALSRGKLEDYRGNFSFYEEQSIARKLARTQAAAKQGRAIAQTERFIERFRSKATKATQVQSRIKALDKVERIELEEDEAHISFRFSEPPRSGQTVLELTGITKRYDDLLVYKDLDFRLERGDRVAIVGVNGAGKSTLAKILAGVEPVQAGSREIGHNVLLSYFAQHQADELLPTDDVLTAALKAAPADSAMRTRSLLGSFLFTGDDVYKKVSVLSGGEKNRLALVRMLLHPVNCLILDEPTNHLDMASKSILQEALKAYSGTLFVVSHDRAFLDPLVEKVVEVRPGGGARVFSGNLSYYLFKIEEEKQRALAGRNSGLPGVSGAASATADDDALAGGVAAGAASARNGGARAGTVAGDAGQNAKARRQAVAERNRQLAPLRRKVEALEKDIALWEQQHAELERLMADPEFFKQGGQTREQMERYDALQAGIAAAYEEWGAVQEQIDALGNEAE